ncbi:MAG: 5'-3' exonuclease [Acidimicrobiales bacterium]
MIVHLIDGTYELFRHHYGVPEEARSEPGTTAATRGVVNRVLYLLEEGATHIGVATDSVVESFRNQMWPGYKTSDGMDPLLLSQFPLVEEALEALGVKVWAMVELEADDALATAAALAAEDPDVTTVHIHTPDKDLGQCVVDERVVQWDQRNQRTVDAAAVEAKFGVPPVSIPDWLALVGDSADGFPGLPGWGAKTATAVLARYGHIESIPDEPAGWDVAVRGIPKLAATLKEQRELAMLFKDLATLRIDRSLMSSVDELRWAGPSADFERVCAVLGPEARSFSERAAKVAARIADHQ